MKELSIEEKELLLKDLCARLPYGVIIHLVEPNEDEELYCLNIPQEGLYTRNLKHNNVTTLSPIEGIKPYLRPMSSMTEDEEKEYNKTLCVIRGHGSFCTIDSFDYLISHSFDVHDLIPKGLAIAVTKENNPYKN